MIKINCKNCNKEFNISPSRLGIKLYCGRDCFNKSKFGKSPVNKGIPLDEKTKKNISDKLKALGISKEWRKKMIIGHIGKYVSGEKHHNWKGGITPLREKIYHSYYWKKWRSDVFSRDNWTCQTCGLRGVYLEAHHIKEYHKIISEYNIKSSEQAFACKELWDINNGVCLCKDCHQLTKNGKPKIN